MLLGGTLDHGIITSALSNTTVLTNVSNFVCVFSEDVSEFWWHRRRLHRRPSAGTQRLQSQNELWTVTPASAGTVEPTPSTWARSWQHGVCLMAYSKVWRCQLCASAYRITMLSETVVQCGCTATAWFSMPTFGVPFCPSQGGRWSVALLVQ